LFFGWDIAFYIVRFHDFQIEDPVHIDVPLNQMNKAKWFDFNKNCATDYANRIPKWKFWK
jgi:hypothetical protein